MATLTGTSGNETLTGGTGADTISGDYGNDTLYGGDGNDSITGGPASIATNTQHLSWAGQGANGSSIAGGFTQNTGGTDVKFTYANTGIGTSTTIDTTSTQYVATGESFATNSSGNLTGSGTGADAQVTFDFSAGGVTTNVTNVAFRLNDIDGTKGSWKDVLKFTAYDAAGNVVPVTIAVGTTDTLSGQTITAGNTSESTSDAGGSSLITITGSVAKIVIDYSNAGNSQQFVEFTDIYFKATPTDNDVIAAGNGNDFAYGGAGNDQINGDAGNDLLYGGIGNDQLYGGIENDVLYGDAGNDQLYGGAGNDALNGGLDNDTVYGGSESDTVYGDAGNDQLYGGDNADLVYGGNDSDTLYGDNGDDTLNGDAGADAVYGGTGNDSIFGGIGNDTILFGAGDDTVFGGAGDDAIDDIAGTSEMGTNVIDAGDGNDMVWAGFGDDTVLGGAGADVLYGEDGNDSLDGGSENDTVSGGNGSDQLFGGTSDDSLTGDGGNDLLQGGAGRDALDGGSGDDMLYGGSENDVLTGGTGADLLSGDDGSDALYGGDGNDTLFGGLGDDTIYGGTGQESFGVEAGNDLLYGGDDQDGFLGAIGDTVNGGEGGVDSDKLDLTAWGWSRTNIVYDPLNHENGVVQFLDPAGHVTGSMTFSNIETVMTCFTPGTRVRTARGDVAVQDLAVGDLVQTRDHGMQPMRWVGSRTLSLADLIVRPQLQPVRIAAGALGAGPVRDMMVSPQHRMLVEAARAEMLFGVDEVLVAATHLTSLAGVQQVLPQGVTYIHLLFDAHEIINADGVWTESFQPADRTLRHMDQKQRAEVEALFPELDAVAGFPAARLTLKAHEAQVLLAA